MPFNLRFHGSKDVEAMKAGKLAIRPCQYTANMLMDLPSSVQVTKNP